MQHQISFYTLDRKCLLRAFNRAVCVSPLRG